MIDTHCHLTFPEFAAWTPSGAGAATKAGPTAAGGGRGTPEPSVSARGVEAVLAHARSAGVTGMITISTSPDDCRAALALARAHAAVWCSSGVHPLYSDRLDLGAGDAAWAAIIDVARHPRCVAWGELGLDRHHPRPPFDLQLRVLHEQLTRIKGWNADVRGGLGLPVVIHCREAFDDLLPILRESGLPPHRFVFHCFTGTMDEARRVLDFGACLSFTGVATYRNAGDTARAAAYAPLDRLMIETDAPFLSPEPHRSVRPCLPGFAMVTARAIAGLRGMDALAFVGAVNATTSRFFGLEVPGREGADGEPITQGMEALARAAVEDPR